MKIAALDLATDYGIGLWDTDRPRSEIMCQVYGLQTDQEGQYYGECKIASSLVHFNRAYGPIDYWVIEEPLQGFNSKGDGQIGTLLKLHRIFAGAGATLTALKQAWGCVPPSTWRVAIYGRAWRDSLPMIPKLGRNGLPLEDGLGNPILVQMNDKQKAVAACAEIGIRLPDGKAKAHNAAEAALLTMAWPSTKPQGDHSKQVLDTLFRTTTMMINNKSKRR
jgi:hypothetical protein